MARLCGWLSPDTQESDTKATLTSMLKKYAAGRDDPVLQCGHRLALGGGMPAAVHAEHGCEAVVIGSLRWSDQSLNATCAQRGSAAALIQAYGRHDVDMLKQLKGSFSFALLDTNRKRCLLAVDRMGKLPLAYTLTADKTLVFGSSTDEVIRHPSVETVVDVQSVFNYVYFNVIPSPDTIYEGVAKLEPGQFALFQDGQIKTDFYWAPSFVETSPVSETELSQQLRETLRSSVERESNGNVGSFLSGGLDSSTVSGLLAQARDGADVFSIGFEEPGYDEMEYARTAAKHFGLRLHEYYVTPDDVADAIGEVANAYDEPFGNSSAIPSLFCARLARDHGIEKLLAGDGGDELFAGNERYAKQKLFEIYYTIPSLLRKKIVEPLVVGLPLSRWTPPTRKLRSYVEQARIEMPARIESYNFLHRTSPAEVFDTGLLHKMAVDRPIQLLTDTYGRCPGDTLVDRMLFLDWKFTLSDNDLRKVNHMCELAGIEVCYPMLDDDVVEFSTTVPASLKLKGQKLRYFFKRTFNEFLPQKIINKPKHGFGLPFGEWLKKSTRLEDLIYSSLEQLKSRGLFQHGFIDELIRIQRTDHAAYYGNMVWVLSMLEQWLQVHAPSYPNQ